MYRGDFINDEEILSFLEEGKNAGKDEIRNIISKSLSKQRLEPIETAKLLQVEDKDLIEEIFDAAKNLRKRYTETGLCFLHPFI